MKMRTAIIATITTVGLALPGVAMAQQFVGANGAVLDGGGAGGNVQNHFVYDGPPNADVTSIINSVHHRGAVAAKACSIFEICYQANHLQQSRSN